MLNEIIIKGLNSSDRVFEYKGLLVKVRLLKKEIFNKNKMFGPAGLSLQLTASICDKKGKAIPREKGVYCILPHSITIPVGLAGEVNRSKNKGLEEFLMPLIRQTVIWHQSLNEIDSLVSVWDNKNAKLK